MYAKLFIGSSSIWNFEIREENIKSLGQSYNRHFVWTNEIKLVVKENIIDSLSTKIEQSYFWFYIHDDVSKNEEGSCGIISNL